MLREARAIAAGCIAFWAVVAIASLAARLGWPAYAAAYPERHYSLTMLLCRLAVGMVASLMAGVAAARTGHGARHGVLLTGALLLAISAVWHYHIWETYPVWYHLIYLAYLLPLTLLGGKLISSETNR